MSACGAMPHTCIGISSGKSSGCNKSERRGSLVKSKEMDEPLFYRRSQNAMLRAEKNGMVHLRGVSGDMSRKRQDGTCPKDPPGETLANCTGREPEQKDFSYKETKWKSVGRCRSRHAASYKKYNVGAAESDEAILLMMSMQQEILGGKGLC